MLNETPGTKKKIKWKSSRPSVASVNQKGKVYAKKKGTATITASVGKKKLKCKVKVQYTRWNKLMDKYRYDETTKQIIFVKYTGGSNAGVQMYQKKKNNKWSQIVNCSGYVGQNGINKVREGDRKTPTGEYTLTRAFGRKRNPGAKLRYTKLNRYLYWCGDREYYNQMVDVRKKPHQCSGEHLISYVPHYNYAAVLDYNSECKYKKGSAIFLHCTGSNPYTGGCIAVSEANMVKILKNAEKGTKVCIYKK